MARRAGWTSAWAPTAARAFTPLSRRARPLRRRLTPWIRPAPAPATTGAPNVIGGSSGNFVAPPAVGATIAGGGGTHYQGGAPTNSIASDFATIGGGLKNMIESNADD